MPDEMREKIDHGEITNKNYEISLLFTPSYIGRNTNIEKIKLDFFNTKNIWRTKMRYLEKKHEHVQLAGSRPITVAREEIKCSIFRLTEIIVFWYYVSFYYSYSMTTFGIFLCICCKGLMTQSINSSPLRN